MSEEKDNSVGWIKTIYQHIYLMETQNRKMQEDLDTLRGMVKFLEQNVSEMEGDSA